MMKILFMGTPDFAVFSLSAMVEAGLDVVGVLTQPDKPKGRGYELQPSPVKQYALAHGIPVYQPQTLKNGAFDGELAAIRPDVIVVTAYGKILPSSVLHFPKYGCINVHGSLLPRYRGAAPMQRAIMEGCAETGVTTMLMDEGVDTGDMLESAVVKIEEEDNFEDIHDKLGKAGAALLLHTLNGVVDGSVKPQKQPESGSSYAAKIEKEDCALDFSKSARELHNLVRGLSPFPLSFTHTPDGKLLKILAARVGKGGNGNEKPGTVLALDNGCVTVACGEGSLELLSLLPEGKSRMDAAAYINGRRLKVGDILSN